MTTGADTVGEPEAWRWRNVPVPEQHTVGLAVSGLCHRKWPRRLGGHVAVRAGGVVLLAAGAALVAWATRSAGAHDLAEPERLVTDGAYAHSRHPMYVAWTVAYVGVAGLADSDWPLILLPGVATAVHRRVRREEARLTRRFGVAYQEYASRVRRYL